MAIDEGPKTTSSNILNHIRWEGEEGTDGVLKLLTATIIPGTPDAGELFANQESNPEALSRALQNFLRSKMIQCEPGPKKDTLHNVIVEEDSLPLLKNYPEILASIKRDLCEVKFPEPTALAEKTSGSPVWEETVGIPPQRRN